MSIATTRGRIGSAFRRLIEACRLAARELGDNASDWDEDMRWQLDNEARWQHDRVKRCAEGDWGMASDLRRPGRSTSRGGRR